MKVNFNQAQLSRVQRESLITIVYHLQADNDVEIEVSAVEFPDKLLVKGDDDIGMVILWDPDRPAYVPFEKSESLTETKPEPKSELAPDLEGIKTHAHNMFIDVMAMNAEQRQVFWAEVSSIIAKELL